MKTIAIISGGNIDYDFALTFMKTHPADFVIGVDRGIEFLQRAGLDPGCIVGDFDSADNEALEYYRRRGTKILEFQPEKDDTDTQIALKLALDKGAECIYILGGTGSRLDHVLGNIQIMTQAMESGAKCCLVDPHNRIRLIRDRTVLKKEEQYGKYVSLLAHTTQVTGVTLTGFYYPLADYTMSCGQAVGISNEIIAKEAVIEVASGVLVLIESRD